MTTSLQISDRANDSLCHLDLADVHERSARFLSDRPRPFLRWAGSKRRFLQQLVEVLPKSFRTYREPFLGGGSLFFLLRPERAVISDACAELVETYTAVRDDPSQVLKYLAPLRPDKDTFYSIRQSRSSGRIKRAAEFIYLNKTCWNGLYRVNGQGQFNVPYGAPKSNTIIDPGNLRACSKVLERPGVTLKTSGFEEAMEEVVEGDLVFMDPPYVTRHNNNGFIDYNERLFSWEDQIRAAELAKQAAAAGAHVIVTNAHHSEVLELYEGFCSRELHRTSTLASDAKARGAVKEAVLWWHGSNS